MYACFTIRKYSLESNRQSRTVCRAQSCRPIVIIIRFVHAFSLCFDWFLPARALHLYRSRVRPGGVRSVFCRSLFVFPDRHRSRFRSRSFRCRVVYVLKERFDRFFRFPRGIFTLIESILSDLGSLSLFVRFRMPIARSHSRSFSLSFRSYSHYPFASTITN